MTQVVVRWDLMILWHFYPTDPDWFGSINIIIIPFIGAIILADSCNLL